QHQPVGAAGHLVPPAAAFAGADCPRICGRGVWRLPYHRRPAGARFRRAVDPLCGRLADSGRLRGARGVRRGDALVQLQAGPARTCPSCVAGVCAAYLTSAALLVLGSDALLTRFADALRTPGAYAAQGVLGAAMLLYSFKPARRDSAAVEERAAGAATIAGLFALGAAVTVAEITTALPYFAATGLLTYLQWPTYQWLAALVIYNLIFVTPPLALLVISQLLGRRMDARMAALRSRLER